jgi:3-deoxy-D-manno-octulosonic-acid transferase
MLFSSLYTFFLHILALVAFPYFLYCRIFKGKYKESFKAKLGLNFPKIDKGEKYLIWIHAVSVGETKAVAPLVKLIKKEKPDSLIVFSNITETGLKEAKISLAKEVDYHVFLPFDLPYIIKPIIHDIKPNLLLITETDFWYHFQSAAKEVGADVIVVNAKVSKKSLKRYSWLPWLTAPIFHTIDFFCVQSIAYKKRFLELGVPPDHLDITGNLKLEDSYPYLDKFQLKSQKEKLGILNENKIIVIGSTHDLEEKILLEQLKKVWRRWPNTKVFLAPRHPERFKAVESLLQKLDICYSLWSKEGKFDFETKVILIDAMGVLRGLYQLCQIAIVGGSFVDRIGGHNILEPSWYEKPVIYGPHIFAQKDFDALISQKNAGICIEGQQVAETLLKLLENDSLRKEMGLSGKKIFDEAKGATSKTWALIQKTAF